MLDDDADAVVLPDDYVPPVADLPVEKIHEHEVPELSADTPFAW